MDADLKKTIDAIRENTGIAVSVYTGRGEPLFGAEGKAPSGFEGVFRDAERNVTFFRAAHRGRQYICSVAGCTDVQRNYAYLIADMVANAGSRVPGTANLPKGEFLRRILLGECAEEDIRRYRDKYAVPDRPCFALAVSAEGEGDMAGLLAQYAESDADCAVMIAPKDGAFIKFTEADSEYQSSADFANFLAQSFQEELGIRARVGIGCTVRRFEDVAQSYTQASVALRMSAQFNTAGDVHSYREFVLIRLLEELPAARRAEYLSVLLDGEARELLKDEDLASTAEEFLGNDLNVSETSRNLYMHRNTLMYRLDKLERMTGLNLRKFSDAVTFRVITILNRLV